MNSNEHSCLINGCLSLCRRERRVGATILFHCLILSTELFVITPSPGQSAAEKNVEQQESVNCGGLRCHQYHRCYFGGIAARTHPVPHDRKLRRCFATDLSPRAGYLSCLHNTSLYQTKPNAVDRQAMPRTLGPHDEGDLARSAATLGLQKRERSTLHFRRI